MSARTLCPKVRDRGWHRLEEAGSGRRRTLLPLPGRRAEQPGTPAALDCPAALEAGSAEPRARGPSTSTCGPARPESAVCGDLRRGETPEAARAGTRAQSPCCPRAPPEQPGQWPGRKGSRLAGAPKLPWPKPPRAGLSSRRGPRGSRSSPPATGLGLQAPGAAPPRTRGSPEPAAFARQRLRQSWAVRRGRPELLARAEPSCPKARRGRCEPQGACGPGQAFAPVEGAPAPGLSRALGSPRPRQPSAVALAGEGPRPQQLQHKQSRPRRERPPRAPPSSARPSGLIWTAQDTARTCPGTF